MWWCLCNILIKNDFEDGLDEYNDNINVFDNGFNMSKQNPLYNSDEDLYKRYEEEKRRQHERDMRDMENMAFETVDRFSKTKNGEYMIMIRFDKIFWVGNGKATSVAFGIRVLH